jgi:hypothetical protein
MLAHNPLSICPLLYATGSYQEWFSRDCVEVMALPKEMLQDVNQSTGIQRVLYLYIITLYLLFVLCKGLMLDWFNPKYVAKPYERVNNLWSD